MFVLPYGFEADFVAKTRPIGQNGHG